MAPLKAAIQLLNRPSFSLIFPPRQSKSCFSFCFVSAMVKIKKNGKTSQQEKQKPPFCVGLWPNANSSVRINPKVHYKNEKR